MSEGVQKQKCRSCGADIYWLKYPTTGKMAPLDAEPVERGNCTINLEEGTYAILKPAERGLVPAHKNHFATCAQAKSWGRYATERR